MISEDDGITIMGEIHIPKNHSEKVPPGTALFTTLHLEEQ